MEKYNKIGFVAHGPASANSLYPLINKLKETTRIELFAYHPYVADLWGCELLSEFTYPSTFANLDIVFYGTGSGHFIECNIPIEARKHGIISVSILDCWWASDENLIERFESKPTYIIVPNVEVKNRIEKLGLLEESNILPFGNPYFDRLKVFTVEKQEPTYPLDVAFFSQCQTSGNYSDTNNESKEALECLVAYKEEFPEKVAEIIVTSHPREDTTWLKNFCNVHGLLFKPNESTKSMLSTDISIGVSCTLQYEAQIIGKPTIFYKNNNQLIEALNHLGGTELSMPTIGFDATEKCLNWINLIQNLKESA